MLKLSFWEQFIISAAISFLTALASTVKNETELAALQSALAFLQKLLAGNVTTTAA